MGHKEIDASFAFGSPTSLFTALKGWPGCSVTRVLALKSAQHFRHDSNLASVCKFMV